MAGLKLNPDVLRAAYEYLRETRPFCGWALPDGEDIRFVVTTTRSYAGHCQQRPDGTHEIGISSACVGHTSSLFMYMAHEMVHVHLDGWKVKSRHGAPFIRAARQVCLEHGFDLKQFI